jgi:hypothetical protein
MIETSWSLFGMHVVLAIALFFLVNWIGKHAVDFGYISTTLFEEPNESVALNFFIRALSPAVFIILVSVGFVAVGEPAYRLGIVMVAPYYYVVRAAIIFLLNRHRLVSWPRYVGHAVFGIGAAALAYRYLILPNRSLIPNLETAGNELWLAMLAFLYAVANKIPLSSGPGARRRNAFVTTHYVMARRDFGEIISSKIKDDLLKLLAYSVLVYEDYCRPPAIRAVERIAWWKQVRTTGIMQVSWEGALTDEESVNKGLDILLASWERYSHEETWLRVRSTIADYNKDEDYIGRVFEVMEILVARTEPAFKSAYDRIYSE